MDRQTTLIRQYVREVLERLVSHSSEPQPGNVVVNTNPGCKHYRSTGEVVSTDPLTGDMGKTVTYIVANNGENFSNGDVLTKTLDQVEVVR